MSDAVVIISSDTSYLEDRTKALGYDIYPIDEYNHKNINKISKISYLKSLIKNISTKHKKIYLIYGSGLEDKVHIYDILDANLIINCNTLELLRKSGDLSLLKDIIRDCDFQLPDENPINYSEKRLLSKPLHSFGGYNISFSAAKRKAFYNKQNYKIIKTTNELYMKTNNYNDIWIELKKRNKKSELREFINNDENNKQICLI